MRTGNPTLTADTFTSAGRAITGEEAMTIQGTVNKTGLLLLLLLLTSSWTWNLAATGGVQAVTPYLWGGAIGGLVFAVVTAFKHTWAPVTAPTTPSISADM